MERRIGEQFDCNGVPLEVVKQGEFDCEGCFFRDTMLCCTPDLIDLVGTCSADLRDDNTDVIFMEVWPYRTA